MRVALLSPLPPAQTGIADYAGHWRAALQASGVEVVTPFEGVSDADSIRALTRFDWHQVDLVHAELGGGRSREFLALEYLQHAQPGLPRSATVHDPERLVWRAPQLPAALRWSEHLPRPLPQLANLLCDPATLARERRLAQALRGMVTLTATGADCLQRRMRVAPNKIQVIAHGNATLDEQPLPNGPLRLLYFGFIYPGKGIEDLLDALAQSYTAAPALRERMRLTLAGGSAPQLAFGRHGDYLRQLHDRAASLGLESALDWRLDLPAADIPQLIQHHHVMVLPYREPARLALLGHMRGTSGALSWAAACGRGAIVSDARAFAEEVAQGNGSVYPAGNVTALAERLSMLAQTPRLATEWAQAAARIGKQRRWDQTATHFRTWFEHLCQGVADAA